jgi:hypothetical protein
MLSITRNPKLPELTTDEWARYERACALADQIRAEWVACGSPTTTLGGHGGQIVVQHPLTVLLMRAEKDAARFLAACGRPGREGRPVGHHTAPDRRPVRRSTLKAVT